MIGHRTRFQENGDLPPWRGSAAKKRSPFSNACALMTREIMRIAILGNDLKARGSVLGGLNYLAHLYKLQHNSNLF